MINTGKKNLFKQFYKNICSEKMNHINKVLWYNEIDNNENTIDIKEYFHFVKSMDISQDLIEQFNLNVEEYKNYKIIGICHINNNLKLINSDVNDFMYLITDKEYKILYISIGKCHPIFWYKFTSKKSFLNNFDKIYELYNPLNYVLNFENNLRGFMGTERMLSLSIHDVENHFLLNRYSDKLIWGSKWTDHPFRNEYTKKNINSVDSIILTGQAMRQELDNYYSVSVRTSYSKSIIKVISYDDIFILEIKYNPINTNQIEKINQTFGRKYSYDIPIDIIMTIINFPFLTHSDILNIRPLSPFNFFVTSLILNNDIKLFMEAEPQLNNIINDETIDKDVKENAIDFIDCINNQKILTKIFNENDFYDLLDNNTDINVLVNKLLEKYNCENNIHIKENLMKILLNNIEILNKI